MQMKDNKRYDEALKLAVEKHAGQTRRDGSAYIIHPVAIAIKLKELGYSVDYQLVALLHDVLEDTDATEEQIRYFGDNILEAVKLLSKNYCENKDDYIKNILDNELAKVVKTYDRIYNLTDALSCGDLKFQKKYLLDSEEHYKGLFSDELDECIDILKKYIKEF